MLFPSAQLLRGASLKTEEKLIPCHAAGAFSEHRNLKNENRSIMIRSILPSLGRAGERPAENDGPQYSDLECLVDLLLRRRIGWQITADALE